MTVLASAARVVGRYALYDAIASGGMATVHLGRLLGHVGFERMVAIKRLHAQFAQDPEFVSMFLDEARVVGRIRHPNVVPTLDVVADGGELFIVMEYVQGESLSRLLKAAASQGTRMPPPFAATIMSSVLHGLHAAHDATNERREPLGVVHRDVSPHNILVGTDGIARVLDFGVAKAAGRIQTTREGQLKGKLAYMAPEQISGAPERATDIYAASVVLWEALTGQRLFKSDNEAHLMKLVLEGRVRAPSDVVDDLPPALDALTLRGLSRDPADRFPTARDMAVALEEVMGTVAPSKIGAWVEEMASATLSDRHERIAAIESSSSLHVPHLTSAPVEPPAGQARASSGAGPAAPPFAPPVHASEEVPTELSSSSAEPLPRTSGPPRPLHGGGGIRPATWLAVAGGLLLLGAVAVVRQGMGREAGANQASSAPVAPAPVESVVISPTTAPSASASPRPEVAAGPQEGTDLPSSPAPTNSAPSARAPSGVPSPVPAGRTQPRPATHSKNCDPPYVLNAAGHRVYKRECE